MQGSNEETQRTAVKISNLRYADDVVLLAETLEELQNLLNRGKAVSKQFGLILHSGKKALRVDKSESNIGNDRLLVDNDEIKFVNNVCYLV